MTDDLNLWHATATALGWHRLDYRLQALYGLPPNIVGNDLDDVPRWHERADLALRDVAPRLPAEWFLYVGPELAEVYMKHETLVREIHDGTGEGLNRAVARALCRALVESVK